ncbi:orotidine 5'-phosphate decarboxylase Ura4 [Neoconidiobolus thromboides FSU 785]|nr:orotidine 5'-phosphate decarboxylase Ura4 [Neoconidiobolus thromboides FSU 785]
MSNYRSYTYQQKAELQQNVTAKEFLNLVIEKESNLCLSLDVTSKKKFLELADQLGPYICLLKTHIDILEDFDYSIIEELQFLAKKHNFMIFEDRKFADIGNTVKNQYLKGVYRIAQWADFTNCHIIPGEGIIQGLKSVGLDTTLVPKPRALLLLAQMSSAGSLATGDYTEKNVKLADQHSDFVAGFIAAGQLKSEATPMIVMTPGIGLEVAGDAMGQQYRTPESIITKNHSDIIIVGRNIINSENPVKMAKKYREVGWEAYLKSVKPSP